MNNVKRTFWSYATYGLLIIFCLIKIFTVGSSWNSLWIFIGISSTIILFRLFFKPYYFEIKGTRLIINRDLFYEDSMELNDIEKFEINPGPLSKSYIKLKDFKMGHEFNYYIVNDKDLNKLKQTLGA
jgi:hypothetical protein